MNVNFVVKKFFEENKYDKLADKILLVRQDGINIYSNIQNSLEATSMGALVGGVWQAAQALSELSGTRHELLEYRLGYDTSADGLYIVPLKISGKIYYLASMYLNQSNPGKLKKDLRYLKDDLENHLCELMSKDLYATNEINSNEIVGEKQSSGFLFDDISDDEMDNLFSFEGA